MSRRDEYRNEYDPAETKREADLDEAVRLRASQWVKGGIDGIAKSIEEHQSKKQRESMIQPGMSEDEIDRVVRLRIIQWYKQRSEFLGHLFAYPLVNILLWGIYLITRSSDQSFPWPALVSFFWAFGLIGHAVETWRHSPAFKARKENAIQDAVEREKQRLGVYEKAKRSDLEKPKRAQPMRLTDEGELTPLDELLDENAEQPPRSTLTNRRG